MRVPFSRFLFCLPALLALAGPARPASAQIPDTFTNLKVLPKDISKEELVGIMRRFSGALGIRCTGCHVSPNPGSLEGADFASDDKEEKRVARVMMAMVSEINGTLIPKTGIKNPIQVSCATCHHGVNRPESIVDITKREYEKGGVKAAREQYLSLKELYYGSDAYDFQPSTLGSVAEWAAEEKKDLDGAIALLKLSLEQAPDEAWTCAMLGHLQASAGLKEDAIASLRRALELDPADKRSARLLETLQSGK